jgi:hypothetical protein
MMPTYRRIWTVLAVSLGGVGAAVALLSVQGGVVFSIAALAGVIAVVTHYSLGQGGATWTRKEDLPTVATVGAAVGVALTGYVALLGQVWVPGALLMAAVSPAVLGQLGRVVRRLPELPTFLTTDPGCRRPVTTSADAGPATSEPAPEPGPIVIISAASMTLSELCLAWQASFLALSGLRDGRDSAQRALLVNNRQQYLDELETRDPAGFARWLAAGAGPGSDPSRYLKSAERPRS